MPTAGFPLLSFGCLLVVLVSGMTACSQMPALSLPGTVHPANLGYVTEDGQKLRKTRLAGKVFYSYPGVGGLTFLSQYLLQHTEIQQGETVLDLGTGSGVQAIFAAEQASHVLATDIDDNALQSALRNAREHGVAAKVSVRNSDLFNAIRAEETFDVIIVSLPMAWDEKDSFNWNLYERFFADAGQHLNPDGRIYFLAGFLRHLPRMQRMIEANGLKIMRLDMAYAPQQGVEPMVYILQHRPKVEEEAKQEPAAQATPGSGFKPAR
jgi:release factor glutamine methyltransferase